MAYRARSYYAPGYFAPGYFSLVAGQPPIVAGQADWRYALVAIPGADPAFASAVVLQADPAYASASILAADSVAPDPAYSTAVLS